MDISKIHIYGKYIRLNFFRTDLEFLRDAKKDPKEINRMYNKWFARDDKSVRWFNEQSEYYSEFKGITDPKRVEVLDKSNKCVFAMDINDIKELIDFTKQNLYPVFKKNNQKSYRSFYSLDIDKKYFLWNDDSIGLLYGGLKGEGVLKFDLQKNTNYASELMDSVLKQMNMTLFFDITTFWDPSICKPFIDNLNINYDYYCQIRDHHTKESFEPFTTEIIPTRLGKLSKHRKLIINPRVGLNS